MCEFNNAHYKIGNKISLVISNKNEPTYNFKIESRGIYYYLMSQRSSSPIGTYMFYDNFCFIF